MICEMHVPLTPQTLAKAHADIGLEVLDARYIFEGRMWPWAHLGRRQVTLDKGYFLLCHRHERLNLMRGRGSSRPFSPSSQSAYYHRRDGRALAWPSPRQAKIWTDLLTCVAWSLTRWEPAISPRPYFEFSAMGSRVIKKPLMEKTAGPQSTPERYLRTQGAPKS